MFTLTLEFPTLQELHAATGRLAAVEPPTTLGVIAHADRPDVGREEPDLDPRTGLPRGPLVACGVYNPFTPLADMPAPATGAAFNPFAPAASVSAPLPGAPSTAVAAASPTAPAAPPAGLPPPPTGTLPPAPPTGSAAGAPGAPVPPPGFAPTADRDANGLPWDHRIHGSTRTRNADNTWRQKRGVDKALVAQVEAELRQAVNAVAAVPPAQPAAQVPPTPPAAPAAPQTFAQLMEALAPHMASGKISNLTVGSVLGESKLANLFQLAQVTPEVLAAVATRFAPHLAAANAA